jgi:hypothetical protein
MSATLRHRHPDYPDAACGVMVIVRDDGTYQQLGLTRRKCWNCKLKLRSEDVS